MTCSHSPILTAAAAHQRQHELRCEAAQWRAATRAMLTTTQPPAAGAASWLSRAVRRLGRLRPARPAPGAEAWSQA
jgi:hypothetical protein